MFNYGAYKLKYGVFMRDLRPILAAGFAVFGLSVPALAEDDLGVEADYSSTHYLQATGEWTLDPRARKVPTDRPVPMVSYPESVHPDLRSADVTSPGSDNKVMVGKTASGVIIRPLKDSWPDGVYVSTVAHVFDGASKGEDIVSYGTYIDVHGVERRFELRGAIVWKNPRYEIEVMGKTPYTTIYPKVEKDSAIIYYPLESLPEGLQPATQVVLPEGLLSEYVCADDDYLCSANFKIEGRRYLERFNMNDSGFHVSGYPRGSRGLATIPDCFFRGIGDHVDKFDKRLLDRLVGEGMIIAEDHGDIVMSRPDSVYMGCGMSQGASGSPVHFFSQDGVEYVLGSGSIEYVFL